MPVQYTTDIRTLMKITFCAYNRRPPGPLKWPRIASNPAAPPPPLELPLYLLRLSFGRFPDGVFPASRAPSNPITSSRSTAALFQLHARDEFEGNSPDNPRLRDRPLRPSS